MPSIHMRLAFLAIAASAARATVSTPPDCATTAFSTLATNPSVAQCMIESEVPILTLTEPPTQAQLAVFCKTGPCRELAQLFIDLDPVECTLPFGSRLALRSDIIDRTIQECKRVGVPLKFKTPLSNVTSNATTSAASETQASETSASAATRQADFAASVSLATLALVFL